MKNTFILILLLVQFVACAQSQQKPNLSQEPKIESSKWWYLQGQNKIKQLSQTNQYPTKAKNVILFVGDGMSVSTITAARILAGQQLGQFGEEFQLSFEKFPFTALSKTYNTNLQTPDSAGTMSAMMTGIKTKGGVISLGPEVSNGNCNSAKNNNAVTLLELAEIAGMSTGIVSTARMTHATPAATYAHSVSRSWEADSDIPKAERQKGCVDIAKQLIDFPFGDGIEVALGGGRKNFLPKQTQDPEYPHEKGVRTDHQDLMQKWQEKHPDAKAIWNKQQFDQIDVSKTKHLLGVFEPSHMQFEQDRAHDKAGEPSLTQMAEKSLQILTNTNKPYFLMIESGRIDHGHHAGNAYRALTDAIEFSHAIQKIVESVDLNETLIIVTADHSHTFNIAGYPQRGNPILGLVKTPNDSGEMVGELAKDAQGKPYTTLSYANGPGYVNGDQRPDLTHVEVQSADYRQASTIPMHSETHSGEDVAIYAIGAGSQLVHGTMEQNVIFHIMHHAIEANLK
jgi:alkaline phosphatase